MKDECLFNLAKNYIFISFVTLGAISIERVITKTQRYVSKRDKEGTTTTTVSHERTTNTLFVFPDFFFHSYKYLARLQVPQEESSSSQNSQRIAWPVQSTDGICARARDSPTSSKSSVNEMRRPPHSRYVYQNGCWYVFARRLHVQCWVTMAFCKYRASLPPPPPPPPRNL